MEYSFINDPDLRNRLEKASKFNKGNINSRNTCFSIGNRSNDNMFNTYNFKKKI